MFAFRQRLRPFAWLALVATLALALLPTMSHALNHVRAAGDAAEVCTAHGPRLVAVDAAPADSGAPAHAGADFEHCAYCALSAHAALPPPAVAAPLFVPLAGPAVPPLFLHAPRTLFAWRTAQPRGPPAVS